MIVLSRKKGESVVIGNDITITIVEIRADKVRLGVSAPVHMPVHRQEIYEAIFARSFEPEPIVRSASRSTLTAPVALSSKYSIEIQYLLRFSDDDENASRVREFLRQAGVATETDALGRHSAALTQRQYDDWIKQFRVQR
jgi:carbon storage regulator